MALGPISAFCFLLSAFPDRGFEVALGWPSVLLRKRAFRWLAPHFCFRLSVFCFCPSAVGGGAGRLRRIGLGSKRPIQVVAGVGIVRLESQGFLELADRLVDLAFLAEGDAEVVVGLGVIRFQADGFLVLADRLVGLAFRDEGDCRGCCGRRRDPVSGGGLPGIGGSPRRFGLSCRGRCRGCCGRRRNPVSGGWLPGIGGSPRRFGLS